MNRSVGLLVIALGVGAILLGLAVWSGALSWFGRLPGDIRLGGDRTRVYIPLTSGIIISVVLTVLANILVRLLR